MAREYKEYVAKISIALGNASTSFGDKIVKGTPILFDGFHIKDSEGKETPMPFLKGAIQKGWIVEAESDQIDTPLVPIAAPMMIGPSKHSGNETNRDKTPLTVAEPDETVVVSGSFSHSANPNASADPKHNARLVSPSEGSYSTAAEGKTVKKTMTPTKKRMEVTPNTPVPKEE